MPSLSLSMNFATFFCSYLFPFSCLLLLCFFHHKVSFLIPLSLWHKGSVLAPFSLFSTALWSVEVTFDFDITDNDGWTWYKRIRTFLSKVFSVIELLSLQWLNLKKDEGPWSCLIAWLGWKNTVLDQRRFYKVKFDSTSTLSYEQLLKNSLINLRLARFLNTLLFFFVTFVGFLLLFFSFLNYYYLLNWVVYINFLFYVSLLQIFLLSHPFIVFCHLKLILGKTLTKN